MPKPENILRVLPRLNETNSWEAREKGLTFLVEKDPDKLTVAVTGINIAHRTKIRAQFDEALRGTYIRDRDPIEKRSIPPTVTYVYRPAPEPDIYELISRSLIK